MISKVIGQFEVDDSCPWLKYKTVGCRFFPGDDKQEFSYECVGCLSYFWWENLDET